SIWRWRPWPSLLPGAASGFMPSSAAAGLFATHSSDLALAGPPAAPAWSVSQRVVLDCRFQGHFPQPVALADQLVALARRPGATGKGTGGGAQWGRGIPRRRASVVDVRCRSA